MIRVWLTKRLRPSHRRGVEEEREKMARLETAERDLKELQDRGDEAVRLLVERQSRNHWREAIQQMIQGAV